MTAGSNRAAPAAAVLKTEMAGEKSYGDLVAPKVKITNLTEMIEISVYVCTGKYQCNCNELDDCGYHCRFVFSLGITNITQ